MLVYPRALAYTTCWCSRVLWADVRWHFIYSSVHSAYILLFLLYTHVISSQVPYGCIATCTLTLSYTIPLSWLKYPWTTSIVSTNTPLHSTVLHSALQFSHTFRRTAYAATGASYSTIQMKPQLERVQKDTSDRTEHLSLSYGQSAWREKWQRTKEQNIRQ